MRDDQFQVSAKRAHKPQATKKEPVGFYIGQTVGKPTPVIKEKSLSTKLSKLASSIKSKVPKKALKPAPVVVIQPTKKGVTQLKPVSSLKLKSARPTKPTKSSPIGSRVIKKLKLKERLIFGSVVLAGLLMGLAGILIRHNQTNFTTAKDSDNKTTSVDDSGTSVLGARSDGTPSFTTVKPEASNPVQISYDAERQIAVYQDSFGGGDITITQQPYPDKLKNTQNGIEALAKSLNGFVSINTFATQSKGTIYEATLKGNKQTLIFTVNDVLVFINSSSPLTEVQWATYVESLK